jgi:hypothetical protein
MSNPVTYICINLHGGVCTAENSNPNRVETTPNRIYPPRGLKVTKFTISIPGTVGLNNSPECSTAKDLLRDNPLISADELTNIIFEVYKNSIKKRRQISKGLTQGTEYTETSMGSIPKKPPLEPDSENQLFEKEYIIDYDFNNNLHSIEILNGPYKGQNILEESFFKRNILKGIKTTPDEWHTFDDENLTVFKQITLLNLLGALVALNIKQVYIIDPSCSNGIYLKTARENRGLKYEVKRQENFPNMRRQTSGEVIGENPNIQQLNCNNCDDTSISSKLYNCCTKTANVVKDTVMRAVNQPVESQKMEKREGGKRTRKYRSRKYKTKKYYKCKKNYKSKKHKNITNKFTH